MAIDNAPPGPVPSATQKRRRDFGGLWRAGAWGGAAAIALAALAVTMQNESGGQRLQLVFAGGSPPPAAEKDAETKRLQAQLLTLAADRDRLMARIASLEHNLDDVTGSIKRQAAMATAAAEAKAPPPPPPAAAPTVALTPNTVRTETYTAPITPAPAQGETPTGDAVPLPPTRVATAIASEPAAEMPRKPEIGIDLGGASNMEVLNARWMAIKANYGPLLTGLHPLASHDRRQTAASYRLLVGPLPTRATATELCARFTAAHVICRTTKFDGEQMAQR